MTDELHYIYQKYQYQKVVKGLTSEEVDNEPAEWVQYVIEISNLEAEKANREFNKR